MKTIHKIKLHSCFTTLPNSILRNKSIGFAAKGILSMMLSHTEEWEMNMTRLTDFGGDSRRVIRAAMHQLESSGHVVRSYLKLPSGQIHGTIWTWYQEPVPIGKRSKPPTDHFPGVGKPADRKTGVREVVKHKKNFNLEETHPKKCEVLKERKVRGAAGYSEKELAEAQTIEW